MRKFLIIGRENGKKYIAGMVESKMYPSTIQNDHEYSEKKFGVRFAEIEEVSDYCHIRI